MFSGEKRSFVALAAAGLCAAAWMGAGAWHARKSPGAEAGTTPSNEGPTLAWGGAEDPRASEERSAAVSALSSAIRSRLVGGPLPPDEGSLTTQLRKLGETDPPTSLQLAQDGNSRFPNTEGAAERDWIIVKSLVNLQRFDEAKAEAENMVNRFPGSPWAADVQRHLLVNPLSLEDGDAR